MQQDNEFIEHILKLLSDANNKPPLAYFRGRTMHIHDIGVDIKITDRINYKYTACTRVHDELEGVVLSADFIAYTKLFKAVYDAEKNMVDYIKFKRDIVIGSSNPVGSDVGTCSSASNSDSMCPTNT